MMSWGIKCMRPAALAGGRMSEPGYEKANYMVLDGVVKQP